MTGSSKKPLTIDAYIAGFPPEARSVMARLRKEVHALAPGAVEKISYGMPAFEWKGNLVYFGAFAKHIGFYPAPVGVAEFAAELAEYKTGRGSIRFPLDREPPWDLVRRIIRYYMRRNEAAASSKKAAAGGPASRASPMSKRGPISATVDEYIGAFPKDVQAILKKLRKVVNEAAPGAVEGMSYGMPGYKLGKPLVYFAAFERHIGLYPTPEGIDAFASELSGYKSAKGSVRFPLDGKIPYELVGKITRHRVAMVLGEPGSKSAKKK